jgi:D-arginine dehydrogenase
MSAAGVTFSEADILIVGGGIAGASAAAELAASAKVIVLERESQCGYHATGRSAASFTENYGTPLIRRLAIASRPFFEAPPKGFSDHPRVTPRGMITIGRADQLDLLAEQLEAGRALVPSMHAITVAEAVARVPALSPAYVAGAFDEPDSREVDVNALYQGFLKLARQRGTLIVTDAGADAVEYRGGRWVVETPKGRFTAPLLINAAGAWADQVAVLAGIAPVGLTPKRRTAFIIEMPSDRPVTGWPLVNDVGGTFYFKPDAGRLFVSPSDATPSEPMDAYPEDIDIAEGVERLQAATTISVERIAHSWAGLRTFAEDGSPVVGADGAAEGFFWLAGQGGYGIKTSPALSRACAGLIRDRRLPDDLLRAGIDPAALSPTRFTGAKAPKTPPGVTA